MLELAQEILIHAVCNVKAQTVYMEFVHPHCYSVENVALYIRVTEVELYKVVIAFPALIPERIAPGAVSAEVEVLEP